MLIHTIILRKQEHSHLIAANSAHSNCNSSTVLVDVEKVSLTRGANIYCGSGDHVPVSLVLAVRCVVCGELVGFSIPAQHCPTVTNTTDHQLYAVT